MDLGIGQRCLAVGCAPQQGSEDGALATAVVAGVLAVVLLGLVEPDGGARKRRQVVPAVDQPALRRRLRLSGTWPGTSTARAISASESGRSESRISVRTA